jgi:hypothetical protein
LVPSSTIIRDENILPFTFNELQKRSHSYTRISHVIDQYVVHHHMMLLLCLRAAEI